MSNKTTIPVTTISTASAAAPLAVTQARDWSSSKRLQLQADVVVIGSGAGGAVAAYELAAAGKKVVILEAGPYVPSSEFTENFLEAFDQLYQDKGGQSNSDGDLLILQGRCVGGSTVVNGTVCFRTPDFVLQDWKTRYGLSNLADGALDPYFQRVEERLSIHVNSEAEISRNCNVIREGAEKLGWSWKPFQRNIRECALTGHCLSGCATDRKQSMLVSYLSWAIAEGAQLFSDTRVQRILANNGRASGVGAEVLDPKTGVVLAQLAVNAPIVVLAAGAIQSPLLLLKSELANSSGQVGKNFACHPSVAIAGRYAQDIHMWRGALLGIHVDEFEHPDKGGFLLEAGGMGIAELSLVAEPGIAGFQPFVAEGKHYANMVSLIHDHNVGTVSLDDKGNKRIDYRLSDADFAAMIKAIAAAARIHFAAGADRVFVPTVARREIHSVDEIDSVLADIRNEPSTFRMVSYHPQGTLRMGSDAAHSVIDHHGQSHDVKGLYVADASLLPTSIVVNPQLTIYALASYVAEQIVRGAAAA